MASRARRLAMNKKKILLQSYKTKQGWIDEFKQTIPIWTQEQQKRYEKSYKNSSMDDDYNFFRKKDDLDFFCVCHKYDDVAIEIWCSLAVQDKEGCCVELIINNDKAFYSYEILPFFFIFVFLFSVIAQTLFLLGVIVVYIIIWLFCKRKIYKEMVEQIVKKLESI